MLRVDDIVTSYGPIVALRGVSLEARKGEVTCLLGPNGAGKTTALYTIAGVLKPKQGNILFEDESIGGLVPAKIVRKGISLVPEGRLVFPQLTVRENLHVGAYLRLRKERAEVNRDLEAAFQRFPRLKERTSQLAGTLSGGEQQMLAIARALMARPRLLLMDEPSLGLAPLIVEEIFREIRKLQREGTTILLVEQNARLALEVSQRFYLLKQGRITLAGVPGEMDHAEIIHRAYLGAA